MSSRLLLSYAQKLSSRYALSLSFPYKQKCKCYIICSTQKVVCRIQRTGRGYIQATAVITLACTNLQTFMESKTESSKHHAQNTDINTNVTCFQNSHITNATSVKRIMSNYKSHQIQNTTKPQKNAVNQWKAHQSWQYFIRDATCRKHKKAQEQKTSKWKRRNAESKRRNARQR